MQVIMNSFPEQERAQFMDEYKRANDRQKEGILAMLYMPKSSKKELIANIDSNYENINILKQEFIKIIPKGFNVRIEFTPAGYIFLTPEGIDMRIEKHSGPNVTYDQEWNMQNHSEKLARMLKELDWTETTLSKIKSLLAKAKCVSIESGDVTTIGFARSYLGMYSYKLFDANLTDKEIGIYNNGCEYIFYKNNIVLEYGGGAAGSQCFPDR